MGEPFFIFESITSALKAQDLLQKNGFVVRMERLTLTGIGYGGLKGCGHGIYILRGCLETAEELVSRACISHYTKK
ncbi:MAG: hypothetical protein LBS74_03270 [Oscillospiraceae bacterium]|jgi:hypothetical protein|nr:hypothetical protein [Oscillospiraceae bacterium]